MSDVSTDATRALGSEEKSRSGAWRRLLVVAGISGAVAMAIVAAAIGDLEAGAVAAGFGIFTALVGRRRGTIGAIGVGLASAVTLLFMVAAAVTNARTGSGLGAVVVPAGLAAVSLVGLGAAVGYLAAAPSDPPAGRWAVLGGAGVVFAGLMVWAATTPPTAAVSPDVEVVAGNLAFTETSLTAEAGEVTVALANEDLFWHTFTIDELGVDLRVPVGAELTTTFHAEPGMYDFYCAIPGHPEAGMRGVLTVQG